MIRKQRSVCTLPSYDNLADWSSMGSVNYENSLYQNSLEPQFMTQDPNYENSFYLNSLESQFTTYDPDQISNYYQDVFFYDYSANGDFASESVYTQNAAYSEDNIGENYLPYEDSFNPPDMYTFPEQSVDESYTLPTEEGAQNYLAEIFQPQFLQYGSPTITDYGTVALLLRHLIRLDITHDGAVSIYNFPAMSVTTLNSMGNKCYIKHPNGLVYLEGPVIHIMTGSDKMAKITRRGITFSTYDSSLAYFVDEAGTKTTPGKFTNLSQDLTMDVFYDGICPNHRIIEEECQKMVSEATYRISSDGSESWHIGKIRIKQDKWGEVTVSQNNNKDVTISTSPTIRSVSLESRAVSIDIDCFSSNYLTVKKDNCLVTSSYSGLIVQNSSQKAGLDRNGKLVLF